MTLLFDEMQYVLGQRLPLTPNGVLGIRDMELILGLYPGISSGSADAPPSASSANMIDDFRRRRRIPL